MAEEQSFSAQVKDELAHILPALPCCQRMELAAMLRACGRIALGGGGRISVTCSTDHAPVARKIFRLIKATFGLQTEVLVTRRYRLRKNLAYLVRVSSQPGLQDMLKATGIVDSSGNLADWSNLPNLSQDHCRRAYLRGTFLGTGWVSSPGRQHHLELTTTELQAAEALGQLLFSYGIPVRANYRKEYMVLYVKDANHVVRFLGLVGAHQAVLHYEDVRAMKDIRNNVNRRVNAETANLAKTADAAARQMEALERLQSSGKLERLGGPLKELAQLRLQHADMSLVELGQLCNPPASKSAVNHRMRQLMKFAETL